MTRDQLAQRFRQALDDRDKARRRMLLRAEPAATHACVEQLLAAADDWRDAAPKPATTKPRGRPGTGGQQEVGTRAAPTKPPMQAPPAPRRAK